MGTFEFVVLLGAIGFLLLVLRGDISELRKEQTLADKQLTDLLNQVLTTSQTILQGSLDNKTAVDNEIAAVDALITTLQNQGSDPAAIQTAQNILANLQNISGTIAATAADANAELAKVVPPAAPAPAPEGGAPTQ